MLAPDFDKVYYPSSRQKKATIEAAFLVVKNYQVICLEIKLHTHSRFPQ
ncbi:MAG: hypothetical protein ACJAWK_001199 [Candidatus Azotimanducaceae bacterium]|jgi:hypothetical protein